MKKILLVDDDRDFVEATRTLLEEPLRQIGRASCRERV